MLPDPQVTLGGKVIIWICLQHIPSPTQAMPEDPALHLSGHLPSCTGKRCRSLSWGLCCSCLISSHCISERRSVLCASLHRVGHGV